jgi:hypothetical protein
MKTSVHRESIFRQILRHENEVFQTFQIREGLKWSEESPEARRLHAVIQALKKEGIVEQTGTPRKRNQYLMVKKPDELRRRLGKIPTKRSSASNGAAPPHQSDSPGPQRVLYLEERVSELEEKFSEILTVLGEVKNKVNDIHREWVSSV